MSRSISVRLFAALAAVSVIAGIFLFRGYFLHQPQVHENQPQLEPDGQVSDWFRHPDTGSVIASGHEREDEIARILESAQNGWIDAGLDEDATEKALLAFGSVLRFTLSKDVDALLQYHKVSSLVPTQVAYARVDNYGRRYYRDNPEMLSAWAGYKFYDKYLDAIRNNPGYTVNIQSVGPKVLAGIGSDYLNIIGTGFSNTNILASFRPAMTAEQTKAAYKNARSVSCAVPVSIEDYGDVWLEYTLMENPNDAYWHLIAISLWQDNSTKTSKTKAILYAL